ncbi:hypothetical protein [Acinetobacter sp. YH12063]|uniref:hypothetical protein n=1 Tax=Acinetobacter sp. YH12063 TaxID=2601061 RepID=UPI0015D12EAA|nr:hypothetical protein [Acinetobacter sp. YH12063]
MEIEILNNQPINFWTISFGVIVAATTFVYLTLQYLNNNKNTNDLIKKYHELKQHHELIEQFNNQKKKKDLNLAELKQAESELNLKEKRLNEIQEQLKNVSETIKLKRNTILRLKNYLLDINRKANLNLVYGLLFCISGIIFIFYSLISYETISQSQATDTIMYFIPRISLTILIEIFSYFFLNLYKRSLDDIKYFQNEVTNIENKYLAILYAMESQDDQIKSKVIEILMNTERNFILKKEETTIELEKNKIEAQGSNSTIQALKDIINFKR